MKSFTQGDPLILQKPYTKFGVYFLDFHRLQPLLEERGISFFAMENRADEMYWVLHISDQHRAAFDELVKQESFNISAANQAMWNPDHGFWVGIKSFRMLRHGGP